MPFWCSCAAATDWRQRSAHRRPAAATSACPCAAPFFVFSSQVRGQSGQVWLPESGVGWVGGGRGGAGAAYAPAAYALGFGPAAFLGLGAALFFVATVVSTAGLAAAAFCSRRRGPREGQVSRARRAQAGNRPAAALHTPAVPLSAAVLFWLC